MKHKIKPQDLDDLSLKVRMLSERIDKSDSARSKTIETLKERIINLENQIGISKVILSSSEAAEYLGMSRSQIYHCIKYHGLPYTKPNRKFFFDKRMLDEWVSTNHQRNIEYNGIKNHS